MRALLTTTLLLLLPGLALAQSDGSRAYRIGPRDLVQIRVFEVEDLDVDRRVRSDGTIQLPLLGDVVAEGLTDAELARAIKASLEADFLQRASVTVEITEVRARPIRVVGAVSSPGDLTMTGTASLVDALTEAGGLSGQEGGVVQIHRRAENGLTDRLEVRMEDLISGDPRLWNIPVYADDLINVVPGSPMTIYLLGELGSTGVQEFAQGQRVTLLQVIARAGGLGERASKNVRVKRESDDGRLQEIEVSYKRILSGKDPDFELRNGDIVLVKRSTL
jgi:polysaccharide export outer membrane protein